MNSSLIYALLHCETDVEGALKRFSNDEALYLSYLHAFPAEPTMGCLEKAILNHNWEDAFMYAHAFKGLAANLGFIPLYHAIAVLVVSLRADDYDSVPEVFEHIKGCYNNVIDAIHCDTTSH